MKSFPVDLAALQAVVAAVLDKDGVLLEANAGFLRLLTPVLPQPIGARVARFFIQPTFATLITSMIQEGHDSYHGLLTIGDYNTKTRTLRGHAWRTETGLRVLAEYDVAELERLSDAILALNRDAATVQHTLAQSNISLTQRQSALVAEALTDALTGVGNRRSLEQSLAIEVSRVRRGGGSLSAIMADIDHFKLVNDVHGHSAGDTVLAHFGELLRTLTRPTDIVTRFGGEEFIVLLPHTGLEQARVKAEQLRAALAAQIIEPLPEAITSSFGVAELGREEDGASLLARVDAALYQAKETGRNRVVAASS